jgi:hypothetical protein
MKRLIPFLFAIMLFVFPSSAHPGRTDANGGHYNRKTGEYHFHTGEYAGKEQGSNDSLTNHIDDTPTKSQTEILQKNTKNVEDIL